MCDGRHTDYESRFSRIEADLLVLKWMTGAIIAGIVPLVIKAFAL